MNFIQSPARGNGRYHWKDTPFEVAEPVIAGEETMQDFPSAEQLMELARSNPEKLEHLRQQETEALIASAPAHMQRRLRGLQFQIDCKRQLHRGNPVGTCIAITDMMLDSLRQLNSALQGHYEAPKTSNETSPATVVPFPKTDQDTYLHVQ